jgi:predicted ATPase
MITRLYVEGFKNLRKVDLAFGPLTCISGRNGVGKSNLFDALLFLHYLAQTSIMEAAAKVRDPEGRNVDLRSLFFQGRRGHTNKIKFLVEFIAPDRLQDDFGRATRPSATFLRYQLELSYKEEVGGPRLQLEKEDLDYIKVGDAMKAIGFEVPKAFVKSLIRTRRTKKLIETTDDGVIKVSQDIGLATPDVEGARTGSGGRPFLIPAMSTPRTVLAATTSKDLPTVLAARRELQSIMMLQLEPSSLRRPSEFSAPHSLSPTGENLPAVIERLDAGPRLAGELSNVLHDVRNVFVDRDEGRRLISLSIEGKHGIRHPARALSDGTLRFLALAALQADPKAPRILCLEEPENGIHPLRIPAVVDLLERFAVDVAEPIGDENALRQVIFNTHSPRVVEQLDPESIVIVEAIESPEGQETAVFAVPGTWRTNRDSGSEWKSSKPEALGNLIRYLDSPMEREPGRKRVRDVVDAKKRDLGLKPFQAELPLPSGKKADKRPRG